MIGALDIFAVALFFISFFGLITSRNIIKTIIFILTMQTSVIMFWLFIGSRTGTIPPIIDVGDIAYMYNLPAYADPLPQALMLTTIIIGICVVAINIIMLNTLFRKYKTTEWSNMAKLARKDHIEKY
ncbi:MAG: cation:proton antiporter subunit C [Defluviitaleaceae bacterium]|nr:cation:proton antiporter subunit C [Defluviitaleaceae bacterium]